MRQKSTLVGGLLLAVGLLGGCGLVDDAPSPSTSPSAVGSATASPASTPTVRHSVVTLKPKPGNDQADQVLADDGVRLLEARLRAAGGTDAAVTRVVSGDFEVVFPGVVDESVAMRLAQPSTVRVNRVLAVGPATDDVACGSTLPSGGERPTVAKDLGGQTLYCLAQPAEATEQQVISAESAIPQDRVDGVVRLKFDAAGKAAFAKLTRELAAATDGQNMIAFVVDDVVIAAPAVQEEIPNGEAEIAGGFTPQTTDEVAALMSFAVAGGSFEYTMKTVDP